MYLSSAASIQSAWFIRRSKKSVDYHVLSAVGSPDMRSLLIFAGLATVALAQYSGWNMGDGQVNSSMCTWGGLSGRLISPHKENGKLIDTAAVIRDKAYIDGGVLFWTPGYSNGLNGSAIMDGSKSFLTSVAMAIMLTIDGSPKVRNMVVRSQLQHIFQRRAFSELQHPSHCHRQRPNRSPILRQRDACKRLRVLPLWW